MFVKSALGPKQWSNTCHFTVKHSHTEDGRFIVPLPPFQKRFDAKPLGKSQSQVLRGLPSLECSLRSKGQIEDFSTIMDTMSWFSMLIWSNSCREYFIFLCTPSEGPQHHHQGSIWCVSQVFFPTSVSLNDILLIGPTIHSLLINAFLHF